MITETTLQPTTVTAPFTVVDPRTGIPLLTLSLEESEPVLTLCDYTGRPRLRLQAGHEEGEIGPTIALLDEEGQPCVDVYENEHAGSVDVNDFRGAVGCEVLRPY